MPPLGARRILVRRPATYTQRVQALGPIAYWTLGDPSGTVATDASGNGRNGTYSGVTLGVPGIGDGRTAASFNSTSSLNNVFTASFNAAFSGAEGTIALWSQVSGAAVWTDATIRNMCRFAADGGANQVQIQKTNTSNTVVLSYTAASTAQNVSLTISPTGWTHFAITWSKSGDAVKAYMNGIQQGTTQTGLGVYVGNVSSTRTCIGASTTAPSAVWSGNLAHAAVFNRPLTASEIFALSSVS